MQKLGRSVEELHKLLREYAEATEDWITPGLLDRLQTRITERIKAQPKSAKPLDSPLGPRVPPAVARDPN